ncbi:hypothetical protein AC578_6341 [Pseudocercospora eumusae]|uniref:Uncharacterized protein n=1 Tax=Pseudocercospora eumusae TaxID=321146 RepID=A0A139HGI1_9PEZI|nr:hypothetical protein AC578_6341 [Pseudocercospora eumusae]
METLKSVMGLGTNKTEDEGRNPISGVTGAGTVDEPYDQGNVEGAASEDNLSRETTADGVLSTKWLGHGSYLSATADVGRVAHKGVAIAAFSWVVGVLVSPPHPPGSNRAVYTIARNQDNGIPASSSGKSNSESQTANLTQPLTGQTSTNAKTQPDDNKINSFFTNPFTRKGSISGASKDQPLDPKEVPGPGEEPLPELTLVESAVTIHEPRPVRNPFAPSSGTPSKPVPEATSATPAQPKMDKGKGRAIDIPEEAAREETPRPATVADSGSSTSRRSDRTRTESMATFSTATGASTIGSSSNAGDRRKSYVPSTQNNPGNIPLAGGRPIGRQTSVRYSQAFQYEPPSAGPSSASSRDIKEFYQVPSEGPKREATIQSKLTATSTPQTKQGSKQSASAEPARRKSKGFFGRAKKLLSSKEGSK